MLTEERYHNWRPREHDYDPEWDYEINYHALEDPFTKEIIDKAQQRLEKLAELDETPFNPEAPGIVLPALNLKAVAVYCLGTYNEPCILIDVEQHIDGVTPLWREIFHTIDHEVYHAIQDWNGEPLSEEEAEAWSPQGI